MTDKSVEWKEAFDFQLQFRKTHSLTKFEIIRLAGLDEEKDICFVRYLAKDAIRPPSTRPGSFGRKLYDGILKIKENEADTIKNLQSIKRSCKREKITDVYLDHRDALAEQGINSLYIRSAEENRVGVGISKQFGFTSDKTLKIYFQDILRGWIGKDIICDEIYHLSPGVWYN